MSQQLALGLLLLFGPVFSSPEAHALPPPPAQHFRMEIQNSYSTQWFVVYQEDKTWICRTNDNPYFEMKSNPLAALDWKKLEKKPAIPIVNCKEPVTVVDSTVRPAKMLKGCLSSPPFKELADTIIEACSIKKGAGL